MKNKKIITETEVLKILRNTLFSSFMTPDVQVGIPQKDDCALIRISDTESMVLTTDFIRGPGFSLFRKGLLNWFDLGAYLVCANLSDLAATGAKPSGLLINFRYSTELELKDIQTFFNGIQWASELHKVPIVGGDTGSYEVPSLSATAVGKMKTKNALLRRDAKAGDLVCVTGDIGRMNAALIYFNGVKEKRSFFLPHEEGRLLDPWKCPPARIKEGLVLSGEYREDAPRLANACMDTSDGLRTSIEQLSKASGVGFTIYGEKIPVAIDALQLSSLLEKDPLDIAMGIAPDFELLFTIPSEKRKECEKEFAAQYLTPFTVIGEVNNRKANVFFGSNGGHVATLPGTVWEHQDFNEYIKECTEKLALSV